MPNFVSISIFSAANKRVNIHDSVGGVIVAVEVGFCVSAGDEVDALVEVAVVVDGLVVDLMLVDLVVLGVVVAVLLVCLVLVVTGGGGRAVVPSGSGHNSS